MQWIKGTWTYRKMVPIYLPTNIHHALFHEDLSFHTNVFWSSMICLLALYFSVFTSYRNSFQIHLLHFHIFLYYAFSYSAVSNWASQKQKLLWPPSRANNTGKTQESSTTAAHMCCPHHICGSHISWLVLVEEQTYLPCCREWERESCCDPHTGRVISEDWLTRVCLLKQAEDALSLCFSLIGYFPGSTLIPVSRTIAVLVSKVCFCVLGSWFRFSSVLHLHTCLLYPGFQLG